MSNAVVLMIGLVIYMVPAFIANRRKHRNEGAIVLLNLFLGRTFLGWLAALIWASTGNVYGPNAEKPHKKCPDCAEEILAEAKVCKHCGKRFD